MKGIATEATETTNARARQRPAPAMPVEVGLRERIQALEEALHRTRDSAGHEGIHDLRNAARRMAAFLRVWRALVPDGCFRRIVRDLRTLRRRAGRARDLEAQVGMLREWLARHEAPDDDALEFLREMEAPLERRRRRAARRARSRRSRRLMTLLARAEQGMRKDLVSHLEAFEAAHTREQERRWTAFDSLRAALETADDADLHRTRLAIEQWRCALESLGERGAGAALDGLRRLHEALEAILGCSALRAALADHIGEPGHRRATRTLSSILAELDAERFEPLQRFRAIACDFLRSVDAPAGAQPRARAN
jgi:CHAD domain-containing protein